MYDISLTELFPDYFLVSLCQHTSSQLKGYISFYKGSQGIPFFGATRIWSYNNEHEALVDSTKLAKIMTYKSLMAGYAYGGAKAVLLAPENQHDAWIESYAHIVNFFHGNFITGADVGMSEELLVNLAKKSSYIMGMKSDPILCTIQGLYTGVQVVAEHVLMKPNLQHVSIAIQGLGKIGLGLLELIQKSAETIYISDINQSLVQNIAGKYPNVIVVEPNTIHTIPVDIFSPCAMSGVINSRTLPELQCKAIVGSANSQLEHEEIGEALFKRGIFYAPDYVVNAGGFMAVAEEYEKGSMDTESIKKFTTRIRNNLVSIIDESRKLDMSPSKIANNTVIQRMRELTWI